ncbi:hypothetical protein CLOHYLEM_07521 [[Clostridium] hylemonae DSM 15053]|uniref:Uncharacterized protein n=1 Tax=[Clostridium] hylemonae DSM 15053 TaxID=553973 RepID=C0C5Y5_9FIRM|nr:hypothetical protein CLOHYLEM_07521 [[Clostridium] hylemonae DSM 15053]
MIYCSFFLFLSRRRCTGHVSLRTDAGCNFYNNKGPHKAPSAFLRHTTSVVLNIYGRKQGTKNTALTSCAFGDTPSASL